MALILIDRCGRASNETGALAEIGDWGPDDGQPAAIAVTYSQ